MDYLNFRKPPSPSPSLLSVDYEDTKEFLQVHSKEKEYDYDCSCCCCSASLNHASIQNDASSMKCLNAMFVIGVLCSFSR